MNRWTALPVVMSLTLLVGCAQTQAAGEEETASTEQSVTEQAATSTASAAAVAEDWDPAEEVALTLDGDTASSDGPGVSVDGGTVTITEAGTYRLSGSLTDGQVVVDSTGDGLVRLVLDGVDLTSSTSAPLVVSDAEEAAVVLAEGSENHLSDASTYVYPDAATDEPNAALFSAADLTITGSGSLDVQGNANDAIASKDGLTIAGGTITVDAADDGIRGKDYLVLDGATVDVTAGGDGLKADNAEDAGLGYVSVASGVISVTAGGDGVDAETEVGVSGGELTVTAGGGASGSVAEDVSAKGLKGASSVVVSGGEVTVDSYDDAVHSNGSVTVSAGTLDLTSADDGVHADADLTVSGGTLTVSDSYEGLESATMALEGGQITLTTSDDGINVAGGNDGSGQEAAPGTGRGPGGGNQDEFAAGDYHLVISGGTVVVDAGGDGLDSNGTIEMSGGTVVVNGPTESMNGAIDVNGTFDITGGVLAAAGSAGMAQSPTGSGQGVVGFSLGAAQAAGTVLHLTTADGTELVAFEASKDFATFVYSSPDLTAGESYEVYVGGSVTGESTGGLSTEGDRSGATSLGTTTAAGS